MRKHTGPGEKKDSMGVVVVAIVVVAPRAVGWLG